MNHKADKRDDSSSWAIGGGLMMGMGVGFFFLKESSFTFVACMMSGLGLGLMVAAFLSRCGKRE